MGDVLFVEQALHALGRADRVGKLGPRQNHHEFLTAVARHDLSDAPRRGALHQRTHPPQHLIAGRVAVVVVVLLEVIHVDEYDREPGAAAPGATDLIAQHLVDDATVAKARQFVDIGQVRQLVIAILQAVRQSPKLPRRRLLLPGQAQHAAEGLVNTVTGGHQQTGNGKQEKAQKNVLWPIPVIHQIPPGDGPQRTEHKHQEVLPNHHHEGQGDGRDHHNDHQQHVLRCYRQMGTGDDKRAGPRQAGQR